MSTNLSYALLPEMAVFVQVVESGSFSAAARKLGTSPSAVSRSVAKLEQALALQLLHRTTRKLRLSESGEEAFAHCRTLLAAADAVMAIGGRGAVEPEGLVSVSVPKAVGRFVLHPHMPEFLRRYPKVDVRLRLEDRYMDLIDDRVDLALRITDRPSPGLIGRQLMRIDHLLCATPHYGAARHAAAPARSGGAQLHLSGRNAERRAMEVPPQRQNGDGQRARPLRRQPHRCAAGRGKTAYRHRQPAVFYRPPRSTTARSCRCCRSGISSAAITAACGYSTRLTSIYRPNCGCLSTISSPARRRSRS